MFVKMKNIFKATTFIPPNVQLFIKNNLLFIKGPLGSVCLDLNPLKKIFLGTRKKKIVYSTIFRLFQKNLLGVCLRYVVRLSFVGIGFRVEAIEKGFIKLKLGFSHFVFVKIPPYIRVFAPKKTVLVVESIDDQLLKEFCARLQSLKAPDAYKGKGILYKNQTVILKEGKKK
ncbi:MAG: 50S ribosomal protein L6 [SAR324 cluster bacterium]|uniref:50S ribosomal protein L6 n=1 Tax=SAR324 cluster bacterium TaxID=2024889 RepID=A0A2A4SS41_9DELT|nr:MAG: 50S ribosomal protein L6 [SAR324 cluster bacterium]